jgi:hypothetical protein
VTFLENGSWSQNVYVELLRYSSSEVEAVVPSRFCKVVKEGSEFSLKILALEPHFRNRRMQVYSTLTR